MGFVPRKNRCGKKLYQCFESWLCVLVQCPKGTFHNATRNRCVSCPFGSYNDHLGQTKCQSCPLHHSTRKVHSKKVEDCKGFLQVMETLLVFNLFEFQRSVLLVRTQEKEVWDRLDEITMLLWKEQPWDHIVVSAAWATSSTNMDNWSVYLARRVTPQRLRGLLVPLSAYQQQKRFVQKFPTYVTQGNVCQSMIFSTLATVPTTT